MKKRDILAVNPGSTSTKVGVYRFGGEGYMLNNPEEVFVETINHNPNHLLEFENLEEQLPYRQEVIESVLDDKGYDRSQLMAVVGRGGQLPVLKSGGYEVDADFCRDMMSPRNVQHASNLGAPLAMALAAPLGLPSDIYDSTRGCELSDVAKISGFDGLVRYGNAHVLNSRAQAIEYANSNGLEYWDLNLIVAHMGGGITVTAHKDCRIIDDSSYDEGPMSPERTGGIQLTTWTDLCYSGKYTRDEAQKIICGKGGLFSYLGVTDCRQVEKMIEEGDHMYNNHLADLYKISGQYVISALQRKAPIRKRRGRRKKSEIAMLAAQAAAQTSENTDSEKDTGKQEENQ